MSVLNFSRKMSFVTANDRSELTLVKDISPLKIVTLWIRGIVSYVNLHIRKSFEVEVRLDDRVDLGNDELVQLLPVFIIHQNQKLVFKDQTLFIEG